MKRARDGCGGQGERVYVRPELAELLFDRDTEFLLLVDDQQPQVIEFDVAADDAVCSDEDIQLARG